MLSIVTVMCAVPFFVDPAKIWIQKHILFLYVSL
ncbi:hypothetical protein OESDEN_08245 [Oesophagostomum dentatum]|uniref:Uncharacterized protein n=1 Tax=Oesophagostomum dentatum TaxID=61180 RepID=A0A0B1T6V8_OESDE|nr:hypothetical protein OESDEN_08245 [Oesophagostomum dentatum]